MRLRRLVLLGIGRLVPKPKTHGSQRVGADCAQGRDLRDRRDFDISEEDAVHSGTSPSPGTRLLRVEVMPALPVELAMESASPRSTLPRSRTRLACTMLSKSPMPTTGVASPEAVGEEGHRHNGFHIESRWAFASVINEC